MILSLKSAILVKADVSSEFNGLVGYWLECSAACISCTLEKCNFGQFC